MNTQHSDDVLRALICLISLDFPSLKQTRNTNWPNKQTAVTPIYSRHFLKWLLPLSVNDLQFQGWDIEYMELAELDGRYI